MTKVKICGLTRPEDIVFVNRWLPDYVGFVFAASRRRVTFALAGELRAALKPQIKAVGVFVNESADAVIELCRAGIIDLVQLHGDEGENYIRKLKDSINCPVLKAVRVRSEEQIRRAEKLSCDMLLLDAYSTGVYGGGGRRFDHALIPALKKPFFLAGGLDSHNLAQVIEKQRPYGIDLSSGVETNGFKDEAKIKQVIQTVRGVLA